MGRIASDGADRVVVTSDNPRSESPSAIIAELVRGVGRSALVVEERRAAIEVAVASAAPGDVVLIAGKGHEDYQIIGGERLRFDDRQEVEVALQRRAERGREK